MKPIVHTFAGRATPERTEVLVRIARGLWVAATGALLIAAALAFASAMFSSSSIVSADEMARAAIFLASGALVYLGGRVAQRVITDG
jgi:hypothetical protein